MRGGLLFILITITGLFITSNSYSFINTKKNIDKLSHPITLLNKIKKKSIIFIDPPSISADGDEIYYPQTYVKIAKNVSITHDPSENEIFYVDIQISSGYVSNEDFLKLSDAFTASNSSIIGEFNITQGKLTLKSPTGNLIPYTDFVSAIESVEFHNTSPLPCGSRDFSIILGPGQSNNGQGQLSYLPRNGHYYEFVPALNIFWTDAKVAAESSNYYGLQGYLATLTAADEAQLAGEQAPGTGWIGANDLEAEGVWRWVTGPEGLANNGLGTDFWYGIYDGSTPNYANWQPLVEPNNTGNEEHYAHITSPTLGFPGTWNDLPNEGRPELPDYQPKGYIVEYGGMPGDPVLNLAASTKITIQRITGTTPNSRCGSGTVILGATAPNATISWYNSPTANTPLSTGNTFTTPAISNTTTYYIDAGCETERTAITATITPLPDLPIIDASSTSPIEYCQNESAAALTATALPNHTLNWYNVATGSTPLISNPIPATTSAGSTSYYVSQTNNTTGCESPRSEIIVNVNSLPFVGVNSQERICTNIPDFSVTLESGIPDNTQTGNYNFIWKKDGDNLNINTPTLNVNTPGIYTVEVINNSDCRNIRTITVITSNVNTTTIESIDVIDLADNNTITVNISGSGSGDYEYRLGDIGNFWQESNFFNNVPAGIHEVFFKDKNGCGIVSSEIIVAGIPNFFTPNNDSHNDIWKIKGMSKYPSLTTAIFDRYGKHITTLTLSNPSWDGSLNGKPLPSSDYWYIIKVDKDGPEIRGHFSLKR